MEIVIDLDSLLNIALYKGPWYFMWYIFINGGWLPIVFVLIKGFLMVWLDKRQDKYYSQWKFVLLAIDIPKENEQSPKAVEHIFAALAGAHSKGTFKERWWDGKIQESFSLEIISVEGYVQFLIWTEEKFRDLVEAAIYSQYPDAEITEVEDYTKGFPDRFPDDTYDIWGTEFIYVKNQAYPIRTYPKFEHPLSQEFKDPMAAFIEVMTKISKGEQIWFQIIVKPTDDNWKNNALKLAEKLAGKSVGDGVRFGFIGDEIKAWFLELWNQITGIFSTHKPSAEAEKLPSMMLYLTPGEKTVIEAIEEKVSKIGFLTKIRMIYLARHEVMKKSLAVNGFVGAIKQYNTVNLNALKTDTKKTATTAHYALAKKRIIWKKNKIMKAYKERNGWMGRSPFIMNIEELATLYHFPTSTVRTAMVQTIQAKKGPPSSILPVIEEVETKPVSEEISRVEGLDEVESEEKGKSVMVHPEQKPVVVEREDTEKRAGPPQNLPTV